MQGSRLGDDIRGPSLGAATMSAATHEWPDDYRVHARPLHIAPPTDVESRNRLQSVTLHTFRR